MANIYYDKDADPDIIRGRKVAVIGYGSQGHAHARNMAESGVDVVVGLREGSSSQQEAEADGMTVMRPDEAAAWADVVMLLVPDQHTAAVYEESVAANLAPGDALMFAHYCKSFPLSHLRYGVVMLCSLACSLPKPGGSL